MPIDGSSSRMRAQQLRSRRARPPRARSGPATRIRRRSASQRIAARCGSGNPAFSLVGPLLSGYFGKVSVVAAPRSRARRGRGRARLQLVGMGNGVQLEARRARRQGDAHRSERRRGPEGGRASLGALVKTLGTSLDSFVPINGPLEAVDCTDNYPEWTGTLTFDDGSKLELSTHRSNLLASRPVQITVDKITYLQLAPGSRARSASS